MNEKGFYWIIGTIFTIIAILHLFRIIFRWKVVLNNFIIPLWASWAALIICI